ncbi:hypothetical protein ABIB57_004446 [Devosia sp. UYZn731]
MRVKVFIIRRNGVLETSFLVIPQSQEVTLSPGFGRAGNLQAQLETTRTQDPETTM